MRLRHGPHTPGGFPQPTREFQQALSLHRLPAGNRAPHMRTARMNFSSTCTRLATLLIGVGLLSTPVAEARKGGGGSCVASDTQTSLVNCGAIPSATGTRRLRLRADCSRDLRVEI